MSSHRSSDGRDQAATQGDISPIFPASLLIYERSGDLELNGEIETFWAGDKILKGRITAGLRQIGQQQNYKFNMPKVAELPPQRLRFALELIKGARYRGWVVLLDEIELGRFLLTSAEGTVLCRGGALDGTGGRGDLSGPGHGGLGDRGLRVGNHQS